MLNFTNDSFIKNAFDYAPIGMAIVALDGKWLKVNPALAEITGYSQDELLNLSYQKLTYDEDLELNNRYAEKLINGEMDSFIYEKRYIHRDGSVVWVQLTSSLIRDEAGEPLYFVAQMQDISVRKKTEEQLKKSEERLRVVFEKAGMGIAIRDPKKRAIEINPMFLDILGYTKEEFLHISFADLSHPEDIKRENELIVELLEGKRDYYSMEKRYLRKDNEWRWCFLTVCLFPSDEENTDNLLATVVDITERKIAEQKLIDANTQLKLLSASDGLTGIANRRYFDEYLQREWSAALRHGSPISLVMFDIDSFKNYNDTYGHLSGDDCLRKVASTVDKFIKRKTDLFARYGGEEFAVILPLTAREGALFVANRIYSNVLDLQIPHDNPGTCNVVTISVGVATIIPDSSNDPTTLISMADAALYTAKKQGRNQVVQYKE